jgi:hypothetical protein
MFYRIGMVKYDQVRFAQHNISMRGSRSDVEICRLRCRTFVMLNIMHVALHLHEHTIAAV